MKNDIKRCKRCKIKMKLGEAIDFKDPNIREAYTTYSKGNLVKCWKCPKCGGSESLYE